MKRHTDIKKSAISNAFPRASRNASNTLNKLATHSILRALLVCTLICFALAGYVSGQVATGRIAGRITDPTGAVVPNASVSITNEATGVVQTVLSNSNGDYIFQAVNPGSYALRVEVPQLEEFYRPGIQAHIQDNITIDVTLQVGSISQRIEVTGSAPLLQEQDASIGQTIEEQQVNDMPLQSRDWTTLGMLAAGASTSGGSSNAQFNVMGEDWTQNDFRLNGIDDNVEIYGGGNIQGAGGNNGYTAIVPPPDAIQEFKLQTGNYSAEFGHSTGGIINAAIKSGTNALHGDLWEYVRNTLFNANDYFANQTNTPRPAYHQNEFGGTVGGPVFIPRVYNGKNKTFFFFDYQGTRIRQPSDSESSVPTTNMRSSGFTNFQDFFNLVGGTKTDALGRVFPLATFLDPATTRLVAANSIDPVSGLPNTSTSAVYVRDPFYSNGSIAGITDFTGLTQNLNVLPASRIDLNSVKLMSLYPNPTPGTTSFPNYYQFAKSSNNIDQYDVRIDQNFGSKDILFGVFDRSKETIYSPPVLPGIAEGQGYGDGPEKGPRYAIALGYTHIFSPTLTNEFHGGWNSNLEKLPGPYGDQMGIPAQYGIPGVPQVPGNGGLPGINISSLSGIGTLGWMPTLSTIRTLEIMDNVTKIYGSQTLKTGVQIDDFHAPIIQPSYPKGYFSFTGQFSDVPNQDTGYSGVADLMLVPTAATVPGGIDNLGGLANYAFSNYSEVKDQRYYLGAYIQDDWKVSQRLTLNLGVRWDYYTPYQEVHGYQANFIETGGGAGDSGTYYIPKKTCNTPMSSSFLSLTASYNIAVKCTSNNAVGDAQTINFAPRIGFALRLRQSFVLRGGYGITYGALDNIGFGYNLGNNYPFVFSEYYTAPDSQTPLALSNGQTAVLENALAGQNLSNPAQVSAYGLTFYGRQYDFKTPYQETANLAIQDQFSQHDSFSLAYVGTFGKHLDSQSSNNAPSTIMPPGTNMYDPTVDGHVPFPNLTAEGVYQSTKSTSNYHSLQAVYQHELNYGLSVLANYTFSKCLTDKRSIEASNLPAYRAEWLPGFGQKADYSLCSFDTAQVIHASGTYKLPVGRGQLLLSHTGAVPDYFLAGWSTNFIYSHQTGQPVTLGCPIPTTADFGCFADKVAGQDLYKGPHNASQWLNPNAFSNPPVATTIGQTDTSPLGGRPTQARGPGFQNLDMSLFKQLPVHDTVHFEFRAEAFNIFNWHAFANPSNLDFLNPTGFSEITSSRNNPRILQLALKLYY